MKSWCVLLIVFAIQAECFAQEQAVLDRATFTTAMVKVLTNLEGDFDSLFDDLYDAGFEFTGRFTANGAIYQNPIFGPFTEIVNDDRIFNEITIESGKREFPNMLLDAVYRRIGFCGVDYAIDTIAGSDRYYLSRPIFVFPNTFLPEMIHALTLAGFKSSEVKSVILDDMHYIYKGEAATKSSG